MFINFKKIVKFYMQKYHNNTASSPPPFSPSLIMWCRHKKLINWNCISSFVHLLLENSHHYYSWLSKCRTFWLFKDRLITESRECEEQITRNPMRILAGDHRITSLSETDPLSVFLAVRSIAVYFLFPLFDNTTLRAKHKGVHWKIVREVIL